MAYSIYKSRTIKLENLLTFHLTMLSKRLLVYLFIYLFIYSFIYLFIYLLIYLFKSVFLFMCA